MVSQEKQHGRTYTPEAVSRFLSQWAIQSPDDIVFEPSVGEGRFVFDAFDRLCELGASEHDAKERIHGLDIDQSAVDTLQQTAQRELGFTYPNIEIGNIFDSELPGSDAVIGNPPYVIRHRFEDPEKIINSYNERYDFSNQADLYCYFIVRALESLRSGGRFAMIVSNSWMKKKYGEEFKHFLLNRLDIRALIGFKERVFPNRLVNSVCILAEKKPNTINIPDPESTIRFIQIERPDQFQGLDESTPLERLQTQSVHTAAVPQSFLKPDDYWDIWLRAPDLFDSIRNNGQFVPLETFGSVMIGVQTLAKDFYILSEDDINQEGIEEEFLEPIAYSSRDHREPVLTADDCGYRLFWCPVGKDEMAGTQAHRYIEKAEQRTVEKRYSDETYDGLHRKTRIKKANRSPWYNLTDEAENRLPAHILLPRRVYQNYMALWNQDEVIPNENFLAVTVESENYVKPLLAYLNSSLGELCLRLSGQVYGGGVCDLNVSSAKTIHTIDLNALSESDLSQLESAFDVFVDTHDRSVLDDAVCKIVHLGAQQREEIEEALDVAIEESLSK